MQNDQFKLEFWDSSPFIKAADVLVAADEPMRALQLLDNLPGYYRDYPPKEILDMKRDIYAKLATATFYQKEDTPGIASYEEVKPVAHSFLRYQLVQQDVAKYNQEGKTPHIIDLGPGKYYLPIALKGDGLKFTYQDLGFNGRSQMSFLDHHQDLYVDKAAKGSPVIFVACENIEHLHHEEDIKAECYRTGTEPDIVHISTPKYTYDTRQTRLNWREHGDIGHLRTYTLPEFIKVCNKMFPTYRINAYDSSILHLRLERGI